MRLRRRAVFARALLPAAVVVGLALFASQQASAAPFGGRGFGGSRSFTMQRVVQPRVVQPRVSTMPRMKTVTSSKMPGAKTSKYGNQSSRLGARAATSPDGRKPPKGPTVGEKPPRTVDGGGATRPPRPDRPIGPGRDPRPPRGPGIGPVIVGTGVAIGTGAAVGSAVAAPSPSLGGPTGPAGSGPGGPPSAGANINIPPLNENRFVPNEVVLEFAGNFPPQAMTDLARRHRLARLDSVNLPSVNATYFRARIVDGRPVRAVLAALRNEATLRAGQPNYLFMISQELPTDTPAAFTPPPAAMPSLTPVAAAAGALPALGGDPAQYALAKLRLQEAHTLTKGNNVLVAVIDSGIDASHPELRGVIAGTFDALGKTEKPHMHGTAIAGTIAARSRLMGVAPAARILAIRAFGEAGASAQATTFAIIKSIDHAMTQRARVINMSFNGPQDPGMSRALATARARGLVLVAATGNLGELSPPQYPAADPNVIAVSATDAEDNLFKASNRGSHVAVAAPGVDILVPIPNANYDLTSGTSLAAAHVSGIVALILERKPGLDPDSVRRVLLVSARDIGDPGKDDLFGAGLADAYQALLALEPRTADRSAEPMASAER